MSDTPIFQPDDQVDEIEALLRELDAEDLEALTAPPPDVWDGIDAAIRADEDAAAHHSSNVVAIGSRRRQFTVLLSAAAAVVLIAVGAVIVTSRGGASETTVASATLVHDAGFDPLGVSASATAFLVEEDGSFRIRLDETALPSDLGEPADLELWLIEADDTGNITDIASVALVDGAGTYDVPAGIDVSTHRIVDISVEPRDDDPAHSSRSILRGTLGTA